LKKVRIETLEFTDPNTGVITPYKRLVLSGSVLGREQRLEVKLGSKSEYALAEMILESDEQLESHSFKGGEVVVSGADADSSDFLLED